MKVLKFLKKNYLSFVICFALIGVAIFGVIFGTRFFESKRTDLLNVNSVQDDPDEPQAEGNWIDEDFTDYALTGSGNQSSPYLISTPKDLAFIAYQVNNNTWRGVENGAFTRYKLTNDIDLAGKYWTPIGTGTNYFGPILDGQNYSIKNMIVKGEYTSAGFIGTLRPDSAYSDKWCRIDNLKLEDCYINVTASSYVASLIGGISSSYSEVLSMDNVSCSGKLLVDGTPTYVGGLIGYQDRIKPSYTKNLSSGVDIKVESTSTSCYVYGVGTGSSNVTNTGDIEIEMSNSSSYATVYGCGVCGSSFSNMYNSGDITVSAAAANIYGICAGGNSSFANCKNTGDFTYTDPFGTSTTQNYFYGICSTGTCSYCENTGNITITNKRGNVTVAGICGSGTCSFCKNTGNISATSPQYPITSVGGITASGSCSFCENHGDISVQANFNYGGGTNYCYVGGISGTSSGTNCFNTGNITATISGTRYRCNAGGINGSGGATNCYSTGNVTASCQNDLCYAGGISVGSVKDCFNLGNVSSSGTTSYVHGLSPTSTITNSYYDSSISISTGTSSNTSLNNSGAVNNLSNLMKSQANFGSTPFGTYDNGTSTGDAAWSTEWDFSTFWCFDIAQSDYPVFFDQSSPSNIYWSSDDVTYLSGLGTEESPYLISNEKELAFVAETVNAQAALPSTLTYYKITNDLDLSGKYWKPIGDNSTSTARFVGSIDGDNHTITGITIRGQIDYTGLIGYSSGTSANFKNLTIDQGNISVWGATIYSGGLIAFSSKSATFENIDSSIIINSVRGTSYVGGIIGYIEGAITFENCTFSGSVQGGSYSAGLLGYKTQSGMLKVENCNNEGEVLSSSGNAGGLVGYINLSQAEYQIIFVNCKNISRINGATCGGIIGCVNGSNTNTSQNISSSFSKVTNEGEITGTTNVGGIFGSLSFGYREAISFSETINRGNIIGNGSSVKCGGITGSISAHYNRSNAPSISNCINYGTISTQASSTNYSGGIIGYLSSNCSMFNLVNYGPVTAQASSTSYSGGIVAYISTMSSTVYSSINLGNISASSNYATKANSYRALAGGVVATYASSSIPCIYDVANQGSINATANGGISCAGGIYARDESTQYVIGLVQNTYNKGAISSTSSQNDSYAGGLIAYAKNSSIDDSFNIGAISSSAGESMSAYSHPLSPLIKDIKYCYYEADLLPVINIFQINNETNCGKISNLTDLMKESSNYSDSPFGVYLDASNNQCSAQWSNAWNFVETWYFDSSVSDFPMISVLTQQENWIDYAADSFAGGSGTEADPLQIATAEQLARLAKIVKAQTTHSYSSLNSRYYKLVADIDLTGKVWTSIGLGTDSFTQHFFGAFDGDGHKIIGLTGAPLFKSTCVSYKSQRVYENGTSKTLYNFSYIKNLEIENCSVPSAPLGGFSTIYSLASGSILTPLEISNIKVTGFVKSGAGIISNISYSNSTTVLNNLSFNGVIKNCSAGIIGASSFRSQNEYSTISNCFANIKATNSTAINFGGVSAGVSGKVNIENCQVFGSINIFNPSTTPIYVGGILGSISSGSVDINISNCQNYADITARGTHSNAVIIVGGVVSNSSSYLNFYNCHNFGDLSISSSRTSVSSGYAPIVGGLLGYSSGRNNIENCYISCNIESTHLAGGIVGMQYSGSLNLVVNNSIYEGIITTSSSTSSNYYGIGGVVGYAYCKKTGSSISDCYVRATINAPNLSTLTYADSIAPSYSSYFESVDNYYVDVTINGQNSTTIETKEYSGEFSGDVWFFNNNFKSGYPTLKSLFWVGAGYNQTDAEIKAQLDSLGLTARVA